METSELSIIWEEALEILKKGKIKTVFDLWFQDLIFQSLNGETAVITSPSEMKISIIKNKYIDEIDAALTNIIGFDIKTELVLRPGRNNIPPPDLSDAYIYQKSYQETKPKRTYPKNNDYTFETFVVGESNKFAHAVALAVASQPFSKYNPLFIYGSSGLGKTHLLYAIMNEMERRVPNLNIIYVKGEEFTNEMIASIREKTQPSFRMKYRSCDVLLIDDIQFIAGKESVQEEFFHTFNDLFEENKQVILVADRPPRDMKTLEERLRTRFEWGLIADIGLPDYALRMAIMQKKAKMMEVDMPQEVTIFLAENLRSNIRQLEGAIKKIAASSFLGGVPITVDLAKSAVNELLIGNEPVNLTVDRIISRVSDKYGINESDVRGRNKMKDVSNVRHICVYLIRKLTGMSFPLIGKIFERDHSTIMNSFNSIDSQIKKSAIFEIEISELINEISS